jgi:hypothetical protein
VIDLLADPKHGDRARVLVVKTIGASAKPFLETAARSHKSAAVRTQARKLLEDLAKLR